VLDPSLPIQKAIVTTLKADAAVVAALGGQRVYDRIPTGIRPPYVQIGDSQVLDDSAECLDLGEGFETIHVWSETVGRVQAKTIAKAVADALTPDLTVEGFEITGSYISDIRHLDGGDGMTSHSVLTFRYLSEQNA
jgi:hypothetical protein